MKKTLSKYYPIYFILLSILLLCLILTFFNRFLFMPKILIILIITLPALYIGKLKELYKEWFVFLSFIYLTDSLRGTIYILTCKFNLPVHTVYAIKLEKCLFFTKIPSVVLQETLLNPDKFTWFEKFLTIIHGTHFVAFLIIGVIIWLYKSAYFNFFKLTFYLMISLGISLYFIVPTVPPWMASEVFNAIPKLTHFNVYIYNMFIPDITSGFNTNPISAMPSLHAAFPILCSLILWRLYKWKASPFYIYTALILFTIVYTGDHYIIDIIAGAALSLISYFTICTLIKLNYISIFQKAMPIKNNNINIMKKYKNSITGLLIFSIGIGIGLANKNQFSHNPSQYYFLYSPNYIDFIKHEDEYLENYYVQSYLGNHYLYKRQYKKALFYFERAMKITNNFVEEKETARKIGGVKSLIENR